MGATQRWAAGGMLLAAVPTAGMPRWEAACPCCPWLEGHCNLMWLALAGRQPRQLLSVPAAPGRRYGSGGRGGARGAAGGWQRGSGRRGEREMSEREAEALLAERERRRRARQADRDRELLVAPKGGELDDMGAPSAGARLSRCCPGCSSRRLHGALLRAWRRGRASPQRPMLRLCSDPGQPSPALCRRVVGVGG